MADQRKRDDYTKDRFDWFDQVMADPDLAASAFKVAYAIATSLWRDKGTVTLVSESTGPTDDVREAWIGTREIADKIAMSRFVVMAQVGCLKERGHLEVDPGQRGRGHANHYRLVRKGAPTHLLDGARAKPKAKRKGAPTHLLAVPKGAHSSLLGKTEGRPASGIEIQKRCAGAPEPLSNNNQTPLSKEIQEDGARQARPVTDSVLESPVIICDDEIEPTHLIDGEILDGGVAFRAPPVWIDQHGNPVPPPPSERPNTTAPTNRERAKAMAPGDAR